MSDNRVVELFKDAKALATDLVLAPVAGFKDTYGAMRRSGKNPLLSSLTAVGYQGLVVFPGIMAIPMGPVATVATMALSHVAATIICDEGSGVLMPRTAERNAAQRQRALQPTNTAG